MECDSRTVNFPCKHAFRFQLVHELWDWIWWTGNRDTVFTVMASYSDVGRNSSIGLLPRQALNLKKQNHKYDILICVHWNIHEFKCIKNQRTIWKLQIEIFQNSQMCSQFFKIKLENINKKFRNTHNKMLSTLRFLLFNIVYIIFLVNFSSIT